MLVIPGNLWNQWPLWWELRTNVKKCLHLNMGKLFFFYYCRPLLVTTFYWWLRFYTQILYHLSKKEVLHYITLNGLGLWTSDHLILKHYSWFSSVTLWYYLLLKSVKVIVTQPCLTHCNPMDCSRQAPLSMVFSRQEYWSGLPCPPLGIFSTQGLNPGLPHCRQILYHLSHQGSLNYSLLSWKPSLILLWLLLISIQTHWLLSCVPLTW